MNRFEKWREKRVKEIGLGKQQKAESVVERHNAQPLVDRYTQNGDVIRVRRNVAERLDAKGKTERVTRSFSVPAIPGFTDK